MTIDLIMISVAVVYCIGLCIRGLLTMREIRITKRRNNENSK